MSDTWRVLGGEANIDAVQAIKPQAYSDDTPILSAAIDGRSYPRKRVLVVGNMDTTAHGGAFTVTESATSGGTYAAATVSATDALTADGMQIMTVQRNKAKPFMKVTFTGDDGSAAGLASACVLFLGTD